MLTYHTTLTVGGSNIDIWDVYTDISNPTVGDYIVEICNSMPKDARVEICVYRGKMLIQNYKILDGELNCNMLNEDVWESSVEKATMTANFKNIKSEFNFNLTIKESRYGMMMWVKDFFKRKRLAEVLARGE